MIIFCFNSLGSKLETGFGWCWSLNLGMGLYALVLGIIIQIMECAAQSTIQEFFNFVPWEENDCFDCKQLGAKCEHCSRFVVLFQLEFN